MSVKNSFATRLKALREEKGINQSQLAKDLGISRGSISFYENGDRIPDIEVFNNICTYFDVSYDYFLGKSKFKKNSLEETAIRNYTNLTDENINHLHEIKEKDKNQIINDLISSFLQDYSFITDIQYYIKYVNIYLHAKTLFYNDIAKKYNLPCDENSFYNDETITLDLTRKGESLLNSYKKAKDAFNNQLKALDELCEFTEYRITKKLTNEIINNIFYSGMYNDDVMGIIDSLSLDDIVSGKYKDIIFQKGAETHGDNPKEK